MTIEQLQIYASLFKEIVTGLAALTAAIVAIIGLRAWKDQLKGKTEYELAQRFLKSLYKTRDAIYYVRNPIMNSGEINKAIKEENIKGEFENPKFQAEYQTAVYQLRWKHIIEAYSELELNLLEAEAIWGKEIYDIYRKLKELTGELYGNLYAYIDFINNPEKFKNSSTFIEKARNVIYGLNDTGKDEFTLKLVKVIQDFEKFLKPKLKI